MAPRTTVLVLAFLGVVALVACVQGVEVAGQTATNVGSENVTPVSEVETTGEVASEFVGSSGSDFSEEDQETSAEVANAEDGKDEVSASGHLLARVLHERSSKRCWSHSHCKNHYKKSACCKGKCANLASDNKNCGRCGKCCDTKKGFSCKSGKCLKPKKHYVKPQKKQHKKPKHHVKPHKYHKKPKHHVKPHKYHKKPTKKPHQHGKDPHKKPHHYGKDPHKKPHHYGKNPHKKPHHHPKKSHPHHPHKPEHPEQCGYSKKCKKGHTCCKGKCVDVYGHNSHCGKCGKSCGYGRTCCNGKCVNLKNDDRNCGKCGARCGYGHKCCNGCCKNVFGNDKHNCGACGKTCYTSCQYGMCGYGH